MKTTTPIDELRLLNYFSGNLYPEEREHIDRWIEESEENLKLALDIQYIYFATDTLQTYSSLDTPRFLADAKKKIKKKNHFFVWVRWAAAIILIPLLFSYFYPATQQGTDEYIEIHSAPGLVSVVDLPDGSKVWLNGDSYLKRPLRFTGKTREVMISGEAYFQVDPEADKKFIVTVGNNLRVEILGTEFNVEAYPAENQISTTLVNGSIQLFYRGDNDKERSLRMNPSEKVIYYTGSREIVSRNTSVVSDIAWKDGQIILRKTPLEETLRKLSHKFNVEFIIENEALKKDAFTGTFDSHQLIQILEHFRISSDIQYRIETPDSGLQPVARKDRIVLY